MARLPTYRSPNCRLLGCTLADDRERSPKGGVGIPGIGGIVQKAKHRASQSLCPFDPRLCLERLEGFGCETRCCIGCHSPMRDKKSARPGVEEGASQPRERLRA